MQWSRSLFLVIGLLVSGSVFAAGEYKYTADPDQFAATSVRSYLRSNSDTYRYEWQGCYRRVNEPRQYVQVVCKGKVQILVHDGYRAWRSVACRHNFTWKSNVGKYLTKAEPECTN